MSEIVDTVRAAIATGEPTDWRITLGAISSAHAAATSVSERVDALQAHKEFTDYIAEHWISASGRAEFKAVAKREYNLFLVTEARIGNNASVELMDEITHREIEASRLAPDDELRKITDDALTKPFQLKEELYSIAAKKPSFIKRLFAKRESP